MTTPTILRSMTVGEEGAALLVDALAILSPDNPEAWSRLVSMRRQAQAMLDDIVSTRERYERAAAARLGEPVSDPATTTTISTPRIGDVWTYRTRAFFVQPSTDRLAEEAEARSMAFAVARSHIPEALATIEVLSIRRTPTGRYSAIVKRTRIALTEEV